MFTTTRMWLLVVCVVQPAIAAPVFRCVDAAGVPVFTDRICPGRGEAVDPAALQPNVYTPEPLPVLAQETTTRVIPEEAQRGCDNERDLRHIDLRLKSLTSDARQRRFLQRERKRVLSCQLARLPPQARQRRDAALARTRSLVERTRETAEQEIEGLYRSYQTARRR